MTPASNAVSAREDVSERQSVNTIMSLLLSLTRVIRDTKGKFTLQITLLEGNNKG